MALQLKKLDISMKNALDAYIADWKEEEIIPSFFSKKRKIPNTNYLIPKNVIALL